MITDRHIGLATQAIKFVCSAGVAKIVHDIVDSHVVRETTYDTVRVWAGTAVITSIIVDQSSNHIEDTRAKFAYWLSETREKAEAKK